LRTVYGKAMISHMRLQTTPSSGRLTGLTGTELSVLGGLPAGVLAGLRAGLSVELQARLPAGVHFEPQGGVQDGLRAQCLERLEGLEG
jgi:hypothetical protein